MNPQWGVVPAFPTFESKAGQGEAQKQRKKVRAEFFKARAVFEGAAHKGDTTRMLSSIAHMRSLVAVAQPDRELLDEIRDSFSS